MADSNVNMKFTAQTADAQKRIAELEKEVSRLNQQTKDTGSASSSAASGLGGLSSSAVKAAAAIAGTTLAAKAFMSTAKKLIDSYKVQEQAEAKLKAVMKATGNQIGMTMQDMLDLASATQSATRFGDEAVIEAEKLLVATQALDKDGLQRAITASADLAEAMGTDIVSATQKLSKALVDPRTGMESLREVGVNFTEDERNQILELQEANKLFDAQALILDKVEGKYKGVASAVAATETAKLDKIKNVWGDIKEDLGQGLLDSITPALETLYGWLLKISQWVAEAADLNSVATALKQDSGLSGFSSALLERARNSYNEAYNSNNPEFRGRTKYLEWIKTIDAELEARAKAIEIVPVTVAGTGTGTGFGSDSTTTTAATDTVVDFLKTNASGSISYQVAAYDEIIAKAQEYRGVIESFIDEYKADGSPRLLNRGVLAALGLGDDTEAKEVGAIYTQLGEVIDSTTEKRDKLLNPPEEGGEDPIPDLDSAVGMLDKMRAAASEAAEEWRDFVDTMKAACTQIANGVGDMVSAVSGMMSQIWTQQADDMEAALEKDKEAGDMSEEEEAERLQEINRLRRKAFESEKANNITNALINGAMAITSIWSEWAAHPVTAGILTGLSAATTAAQVATIASQQYTPMAKGGIVTQATPIIAGEAGPEAIIPLSGGRGRQYLEGNGVTINITIQGNADEDMIFHAIERAQRTGYLPNWQYV